MADDVLARAAEVRFWSHVDKAGGCWTWMASLRGDGYGSVTAGEVVVILAMFGLIGWTIWLLIRADDHR